MCLECKSMFHVRDIKTQIHGSVHFTLICTCFVLKLFLQSLGGKCLIYLVFSWSLCFVIRFKYLHECFTESKILQSMKLLWTINDNDFFDKITLKLIGISWT